MPAAVVNKQLKEQKKPKNNNSNNHTGTDRNNVLPNNEWFDFFSCFKRKPDPVILFHRQKYEPVSTPEFMPEA